MQLLSALSLTVALQGGVEVPFKIGDDAMIVDATVNGRKVALMFDTGFSGAVVLDNRIAIGPVAGMQGLRDFVGTLEMPYVNIKTLNLGAKKIDAVDMVAVQTPPNDYSFSYGIHCDGIMGFDVIRSHVTEINFEKRKFVFYPNSYDITKKKPDGKRTFLARLIPAGNNSLEMEVFTKDRKRMRLALDTGNAFYATTHKEVLQRVGIWPDGKEADFKKLAGVASGTIESWYMKMPSLEIYGVPVETSVWSIIDLPSSSADGDGTVGFGFLSNFNLTIDYERRRVWLENWTGKVSNDLSADVGISAFYSDRTKRVEIVRVAPGSPAEKAGIKAGDQLLSIDGKELVAPSYRAIEKQLQGSLGSKVALAVSRRGSLSRHALERVYLINGL
jgi:hypothetical protein